MMHIQSMKDITKKVKIQRLLSDAPILYIPLLKYIGNSPLPIVSIGEDIRKYQVIAQTKEGFSSKMHSPVSGTVLDIKEQEQPDGTLATTIIIKNDFQEKALDLGKPNFELYAPDQLLQVIEDAGIVGQGGAQFPTAIKYNLEGRSINTFIINGTECEPYLTSDYALMAERTDELLKGVAIANKILGAKDIVISIEEKNKDLIDIFTPFLNQEEYKNIRIIIHPNQYPQGGELQLIKSVTGIELHKTQRPRDAGVIVSNVGTVHAIYNAVINNKPVISRIVTISGEESKNAGNYEINIGTPIGHILSLFNISANHKTIVLGGPMMGKAVTDWSSPVTKGTSGILFFQKEKIKRNSCISCGYCIEVCPMHLMPMKFEENFRRGKYFNLEKYSISSCIECAACEYICPSNVPLIESIKEGKIKLKALANAI